jgi:hypothetical protein
MSLLLIEGLVEKSDAKRWVCFGCVGILIGCWNLRGGVYYDWSSEVLGMEMMENTTHQLPPRVTSRSSLGGPLVFERAVPFPRVSCYVLKAEQKNLGFCLMCRSPFQYCRLFPVPIVDWHCGNPGIHAHVVKGLG